ncbi:MAG: serine/threonine protein kinase [Proteobacteria bacterium]|nr:serine/threonine protein kinase [Pseudomonadota bacterium]
MLEPGQRFGHITIQALVGAGGMGEVYRGYDEVLERVVAVKMIHAKHRLSASARSRLLREARILSKLDHPGICRIFDLVEAPEGEGLVLEFIEGSTLRHEGPKLETETARVQVILRVAEALAAAHAKQIVHRDLKPDNVMLTPEGSVKVLDFGIARSTLDTENSRLTPGPPGSVGRESSTGNLCFESASVALRPRNCTPPSFESGSMERTKSG